MNSICIYTHTHILKKQFVSIYVYKKIQLIQAIHTLHSSWICSWLQPNVLQYNACFGYSSSFCKGF